MVNISQSQPVTQHPTIYKIRIQGQLDGQWADWFEGMSMTRDEEGNTLLTGPVIDQAVLHGLLKKIRDLGMVLVSICPVQMDILGSSSDEKEN